MSKLPSFLLFIIIILNIISTYNSNEDINNTNKTLNETLNNTFKSDEDEFNYNPFENFDFGNIIWLDDTNATSEIKKHDLLFIVFYSPWCQHCHLFFPEFVKTSKYAEEKNLTVKFAKIDASVSHNISEEYEITVIPSVFLIYKGKKYLFEGERTKENLLKFMNRKINDDIYKVETLEQLREYTNSSRLVLLCTLRHEITILYRSFLNFSKSAEHIDFVLCLTDECLREYRQDIILFKNFDEKINKYTEEMGFIAEAQLNSVEEFAGTYGVETGAILNDTQINMMFKYKRKMLFYFRNSSLEEQTKYDKMIKELGKEFRKKKIYTVVSDIEGDNLHANVANTFGIVKQDLPTLLFYDLRRNESDQDLASLYSIRAITKDKLNKEYISEFIDKIKNKTIRQDLFSQAPLDKYYKDGLKIVIGRTFDKDVIDEKNNVLLTLIDEYYINPESENVLNIMKNLSKKYNEEKKVIFAYMDAGRNQPRDIQLEKNPPMVLLYANAMDEKKIFHLNHTNFTEITEGEVEDFLDEKLNWGKRLTKEKKENKETEKLREENKKEAKKETQTDL